MRRTWRPHEDDVIRSMWPDITSAARRIGVTRDSAKRRAITLRLTKQVRRKACRESVTPEWVERMKQMIREQNEAALRACKGLAQECP